MIACLILVATAAEARPIIDQFGLSAEHNSVYRRYSKPPVSLVQTGIGKLNAASATAATLSTLATTQATAPVCLNVGITGADRDLGSLFCAASVSDAASGRKWFPQLTWDPVAPCSAIITVDKPDNNYAPNILYEMEAAGIINAATAFTTLEFIQFLKIVSDNPAHSYQDISADCIKKLIHDQVDSIALAVNRLIALRDALPANQEIMDYLQRLKSTIHFSATQQANLKNLLQQHKARFSRLPHIEQLSEEPSAVSVLTFLRNSIDHHPLKF